MPSVTINGQPVFYFQHTSEYEQYPPLLLIHGAGGQHFHWPPQIRRLGGVSTIAPDLPGHGQSGGEGRASVTDYASDLLALMDTLDISRFIPVGHSMGGAIAQQIALQAPERTAGLVLVSTGARLPVSPEIIENTLSNYPAVVSFVTTYAYGPTANPELKRMGSLALQQASPAVVHGDYLACDSFDVLEKIHTIRVPALIMGGTVDKMTPSKFAHYLADRLPDAELHLIEHGGHMLPVEFPDEIASALRDWLYRRMRSD